MHHSGRASVPDHGVCGAFGAECDRENWVELGGKQVKNEAVIHLEFAGPTISKHQITLGKKLSPCKILR